MEWLFQQAKTVQGSKRKEQIQNKPQGSREDVATVASQQAKTVQGSKRKEQIQNKPQGSREDVATVASGAIGKSTAEND